MSNGLCDNLLLLPYIVSRTPPRAYYDSMPMTSITTNNAEGRQVQTSLSASFFARAAEKGGGTGKLGEVQDRQAN